jgi:Uma2 family endonuclease
MSAFTINLRSITELTDKQFNQLCEANPDIQFERTHSGDLVIMDHRAGEIGKINAELIADFVNWNRKTNLGVVFDSSTCFSLPRGGIRAPDVAWVEQSRWDALPSQQKRKFPPICPDFVLELLSPTDNLNDNQSKMQEYLSSGLHLGWILNPYEKQVEIYRPGQPVEILQSPTHLSGDSVLPEFTLNLEWLWT